MDSDRESQGRPRKKHTVPLAVHRQKAVAGPSNAGGRRREGEPRAPPVRCIAKLCGFHLRFCCLDHRGKFSVGAGLGRFGQNFNGQSPRHLINAQ